MGDKSWKDHFLKSGLPLEYEVKQALVEMGCTAWDEYSYIKADENKIEKEFSYDIDANYWRGKYSINFMIECKYKILPTKWLFLPDPYSYQQDVTRNSFLHPIDYFKDDKFIFTDTPYDKIQQSLGPFCLKGTEILNEKADDTTITKAISQLSYAFVEKVIDSFQNQLEEALFPDTTFLNIPVIITNADLYLCDTNMTISKVQAAEKMEDISQKHDFLFFHNKIGEQLRQYNATALWEYFTKIGESNFKDKNKSFSEDLPHFINVVADSYCPEVILIMRHDPSLSGYKKLFDYINFLCTPSETLSDKIVEINAEWKAKMDRLIK